MKQTITIDIDVRDGYELRYNPETRTIEEVKKEPVRSKSWEEFCENHPDTIGECYINNGSEINILGERKRNRSTDRNILTSVKDAEGILALIQLTRLHDEWVGDWDPTGKKGYCAITYNIEDKRVEIDPWWTTHKLLAFPTREMANEFLGCFRNLIEKAKRFI